VTFLLGELIMVSVFQSMTAAYQKGLAIALTQERPYPRVTSGRIDYVNSLLPLQAFEVQRQEKGVQNAPPWATGKGVGQIIVRYNAYLVTH